MADLYEVETGALVHAVKPNRNRFPPDFIFQLSKDEFADLGSQIVISSWGGLLEQRHIHSPSNSDRVFFDKLVNRRSDQEASLLQSIRVPRLMLLRQCSCIKAILI